MLLQRREEKNGGTDLFTRLLTEYTGSGQSPSAITQTDWITALLTHEFQQLHGQGDPSRKAITPH
ncbi:hypothetical protein D3C80_2106870 [compost metagenome]